MKRRFLVTSLLVVAACAWAATFLAAGEPVPARIFGSLGTVTTVALLAIFVFDAWAWTLPGVSSVLKRPDLRGTWAGQITPPDAITRQPTAPIEAYAVVRQTYTTIHMRLFTAESESVTLAAELVEDADGEQVFANVYRNEPRRAVADRSAMHHGGTRLRVVGADGAVLAGSYWTDRWTCGEVSLQRREREHATDFASAKALCGG